MQHDLLHIQGKPYALVPLHEYRAMVNGAGEQYNDALPQDILDQLCARTEHPVKILRQYRGLTQAELAGEAALSRTYLTEIETGKKEGSLAAIRALADALRVSPGMLV